MNNFEFYNPVKIIFGPGEIKRIGKEAKEIGSRPMIVSYKDKGILEPVINTIEELLGKENLKFVTFYEISPNPLVNQVEKGVEISVKNNVDTIIGVGGGSAMDAAKIISAGFYYKEDLWKMIMSRHDKDISIPPKKALPTIMIPTLPATSSEMNCGAVLTNNNTNEKSYVFNEVLYPKLAIMDPELTLTLPTYQSALGAADAISHAMETLLNIDDDSPLQKRIAESVIITLMETIKLVLSDLKNIKYRTILQWAASVAWNGWTNAGAAHGAPMHQLGHVMSAYNDIPHAATLSIIMPAWMRFTYKNNIKRYIEMAQNIFKINADNNSKDDVAIEAINRFEIFLKEINVPTKMSEVGINKDSIDKFVQKVIKVSCSADGTLDCRNPVNKEDIKKIYKLAL